ncbi:hypothetical protein D9M70_549770 [compost metagenome]
MVAGDIAIVPPEDTARHVGKRVPDRRLPAIGLGGTFDLEGGGRHPEYEVAREALGQDLGIGHLSASSCSGPAGNGTMLFSFVSRPT